MRARWSALVVVLAALAAVAALGLVAVRGHRQPESRAEQVQRIAAGLHHRNIVQIIDFDLFDGGAFLVTEYVDGCDLRALLRQLRAPLDYAVATTLIAELATGLDAAHEATDSHGAPLNLVHRDISPSNVLLGVAGEVKIADFGVAKARDRVAEDTNAGVLKGKIQYMAPEQAVGKSIDRRADVWAMGAILYHLLSGKAPFDAPNQLAVLHRLAVFEPRRDEHREDVLAFVEHRVGAPLGDLGEQQVVGGTRLLP